MSMGNKTEGVLWVEEQDRSTFLGVKAGEARGRELVTIACSCCYVINVCLWPGLLVLVSHPCK